LISCRPGCLMAHKFLQDLRLRIRKPVFWILALLFIIVTLFLFETIRIPQSWENALLQTSGMNPATLFRVLYLVPVLLSGYFFGWTGSLTAVLLALAVILFRIFSEQDFVAAVFWETGTILLFGLLFSALFKAWHGEKNLRLQMQKKDVQLKELEEQYRQLFENAHDAIFIHDGEGQIIAANRVCQVLTGYELTEMLRLRISELLAHDSYLMVEAIEQMLLKGVNTGWTTEVKFYKKNKTESAIQLTISVLNRSRRNLEFLCTARDVSEQKRMQENLHYYLQQATRAQEEERKRIALELHDETIQEMVVLSRQLDLLETRGKELSPENSQLLKEARQQTKNIMQSLRNLSQDLRPATLDRLGLLAALDHLATDTRKFTGIATTVKVLGTQHRLPEEVELALFRITQEALRNVWRHSHAGKAEIILEFSEKSVRLSIIDNGRGFYVPEVLGELSKNGKLGLIGMQERARLINGNLTIQSEPGKGTIITVEVIV